MGEETGKERRRAKEEKGESNCNCLFFFFSSFCSQTFSSLSLDNNKNTKQEESRRAERESRAMSERTIDAQRASAPVPR